MERTLLVLACLSPAARSSPPLPRDLGHGTSEVDPGERECVWACLVSPSVSVYVYSKRVSVCMCVACLAPRAKALFWLLPSP